MGPFGPILVPSLWPPQEKSVIYTATKLMVKSTNDLNINCKKWPGGNYSTAIWGQKNPKKMQKSHKKSVKHNIWTNLYEKQFPCELKWCWYLELQPINFKPQKDQGLETHQLVRILILQKSSKWVLKDPFLGANYH